MKVVVLGKSGQVASCLRGRSDTEIEIIALGRGELDLSTGCPVLDTISDHSPDAVINAAAYTAVDLAETETQEADALNHLAVRQLGEACENLGIPMVHISTDYVFDGSGERPWQPTDQTGPKGAYGASKLEGEQALASVCSRHAILRTSWVFSAFGSNFVKTMLRLGKERETLNVVADQIGGPTSADDIAAATIRMAQVLVANQDMYGIWHFSGRDDCSWADLASEIFNQSGVSCAINPIPTSEYPTPALRPLNSRLDCTTTLRDFGIDRPEWKISLGKVLAELGEAP